MMRPTLPTGVSSRSMMAAVVLGTALTASGTKAEVTSPEVTSPQATGEVVQSMSKYCQVCWRNARLPIDRWADCTQQVLVRLLERVPQSQWQSMLRSEGDDKREFIRAIDTVKKRTQRDKRFGDLPLEVVDIEMSTSFNYRDQWEAVTAAASRILNNRQRRIVELTATGWAVPEIASELGLPPERISDEKYKAVKKLRSELGVDLGTYE